MNKSPMTMVRIRSAAELGLIVFGVAALSYCGFALAGASLFQRNGVHQIAPGPQRIPPTNPIASLDGAITGRIEIERLRISSVVVEGTSKDDLQHAVGHISGTAQPGESGNVGLAGHRDTFFRSLRNIQPDDLIKLTTLASSYKYRVVSTSVVEPSDVSVLAPTNAEILTLVTCYPFYFIGPAPQRFIVRAKRTI